MKVYTYKNCSTCREAVKWLREQAIAFDELPIRESPPSPAELRATLEAFGGDVRQLFNTSGQDYRALGLKDKLAAMPAEEALALLAANGNLVKRPFVIDLDRGIHATGFKPAEWQQKLDRAT